MVATIGKFIDSIYFSSERNLFPSSRRDLYDLLKAEVQASDDDLVEVGEIRRVGGGHFYLAPYASGKYQYVFTNARWRVQVTHRGDLPSVTLQPMAELLYEYDLIAVEFQAQEIIRYFCGSYADSLKVTRCDLAGDFQMRGFEIPEFADIVTRARSGFYNFDRGSFCGLTAGKHEGTMQVQVYNKSLDSFKKGKTWMSDVWSRSDNYDPGLDVWRVELRFYREILRGFGIESVRDLVNVLGDLVRYAVGPDEESVWFRVCDPSTRHYGEAGNHARRGPCSWWSEVMTVIAAGLPMQGLKRKGDNLRASWDQVVKMGGAYLVRAASILKVCGYAVAPDPERIGADLGLIYSQYLDRTGALGWSEKVNAVMSGMRGEVWSPTIDHMIHWDPVWDSYPVEALAG